MKKFWIFIALFFPWVILLLNDNPGGALVAFLLQATVIGWIPATIWALKIVNEDEKNPKKENEKN